MAKHSELLAIWPDYPVRRAEVAISLGGLEAGADDAAAAVVRYRSALADLVASDPGVRVGKAGRAAEGTLRLRLAIHAYDDAKFETVREEVQAATALLEPLAEAEPSDHEVVGKLTTAAAILSLVAQARGDDAADLAVHRRARGYFERIELAQAVDEEMAWQWCDWELSLAVPRG